MSINVNVTGNPVRIHRGTMVTANPEYYAKEEFQKRRRMRLEQVRQQSKDIAETVRNKVRGEQNKRLSDMEKQGENELKKWQTRKLLQLQQQYHECLKDIGLGHSEAILEEESDYAMETRKESNDQVARERGHRAAEKLHRQKYQENSEKTAGLQKRSYNQAIENTRAKLVSDLNRKKKNKTPFKKKKRKVCTDINIFNRLSGGSETGSEVPELLNFSSSSCSSSESGKIIKKTTRKDPTPTSKISPTTAHEINRQRFAENLSTKEKGCGRHTCSPTRPKIDEDATRTSINYPVDTRISDRIRSRTMLSDNCEPRNSICDISFPVTAHRGRKALAIHSDQQSSPRGSPKKFSPSQNPKLKPVMCSEEEDGCLAKCTTTKVYSKDDIEEIPNKATVTIRTAPESSNQLKSFVQSSSSLNKVQYYDHKNRYTKKYVADNASVQRIPEESIEVCPSSRSEAEFKEHMFKRDQEAQVRGQKALQKEKVHRDYREMMQQLPVLQKQERVAAIPSKKHTFHMSEDRLKEREKKKQNQMENAYEKLFPKARVITIPPKNHGKASTSTNTLPFQTIDVNDNQPSLNVGSWDVNVKPKCTSDLPLKHVESNLIREATEKVMGEIANPEKEATERKENLQEMLRSLQFHRDKLAKELSSLPESNNLHKLFGELGHIDKLIQMGQNVDKESTSSGRLKRSRGRRKNRSKERNKVKVSSSSASPSRLETVREESEKRRDERNISKFHIRCTSGSSTSPSPPSKILSTKKSKAQRKVIRPPLILQNTSTQTTPTVEKSKEKLAKEEDNQPISPKSSTGTVNSKPCSNELGPCECNLHMGSGKSELCEIVIKITEDGRPEVCVGPTKCMDKLISVKASEEKVPAISLEPSSQPAEIEKSPKSTSFKKPKPKLSNKQKVLDQPKIEEKQEKPEVIGSKDEKIKNKNYKQKSGASWREYLSQNSTSSTSYFSPPDFTSTQHVQSRSRPFQPCTISDVPKQKSTGHLMNILRDKPQQNNLEDNTSISNRSSPKLSSKFVEPYLLCCIKKLLTMSRRSIDDLAVSSVSELSTPSSSIVNIQSNISTQQLENFMQHFNINMSDLQEFLNYSPDESNTHYNTAASLSLSPTVDQSKSPNCTCNDSETVKLQDKETSFNEYATQTYPGVLAAYNKLAENCAKKIENLAAMIEKVRLEKINMLHSPGSGSDKENSTKYMDLPPEIRKQKMEENGSPSPNSILEQEELDRQLLEIDYSLAERLKKMTPAEIREQYPLNSSNTGNDTTNSSGLIETNDQQRDSIDKELMARYKNLRENYKSGAKSNLDENSNNCPCPSSTNKNQNSETSFVPLLENIPRWPKLEVPSTVGLHRNNEKSKPPPSKGISVARRFNNDINIVPHELSTIAEAESLLSTRLHKSKTSESQASSREASPKGGTSLNENVIPSSILPKSAESPPKEKLRYLTADIFKPATSSSGSLPSLPDILAELMKNTSDESEKETNRTAGKCSTKNKTETSKQTAPVAIFEAQSDSSSDLDNMEAMLKSLGMAWAITTLRKTQEALALTSSSSSIDISVTRKEMKLTDTSTPSDISVREVVGKQFLTKLSSTNDSSGSYQFLKELQDLSAIYGSEISQEKTTRRTSTPVQSAKSADKSKSDSQPLMTITGESELSSVKVNSDSNNFDCVPFYSLNESSIKSRSSSKND